MTTVIVNEKYFTKYPSEELVYPFSSSSVGKQSIIVCAL